MAVALNNSISNAYNALLQASLTPTQPQLGNILGINIPGYPLISTRDYFITQMGSWFTTIPLQSQWMVWIDLFPACIRTDIIQGLERSVGDSRNWDVSFAKTLLTSPVYQNISGCIFAQSVQTPEENSNFSKATILNTRGFLPGIISDGRSNAHTLNIDFLETNTSFIDFVVRPWVIAGEHFGFFAREGDTVQSRDFRNVKANIQIYEFTRTIQNISQIPKKVWTFYNCTPVSVGRHALRYDEPNTPLTIGTNWVYTNYTVKNSVFLPINELIKNFQSLITNTTKFNSTLKNRENTSIPRVGVNEDRELDRVRRLQNRITQASVIKTLQSDLDLKKQIQLQLIKKAKQNSVENDNRTRSVQRQIQENLIEKNKQQNITTQKEIDLAIRKTTAANEKENQAKTEARRKEYAKLIAKAGARLAKIYELELLLEGLLQNNNNGVNSREIDRVRAEINSL